MKGLLRDQPEQSIRAEIVTFTLHLHKKSTSSGQKCRKKSVCNTLQPLSIPATISLEDRNHEVFVYVMSGQFLLSLQIFPGVFVCEIQRQRLLYKPPFHEPERIRGQQDRHDNEPCNISGHRHDLS